MWDSDIVEWYYPGLIPGESMVVVDSCVENKFTAPSLNRRIDLHAIDATPARWRGDVGSSPLDGASAATSSPRNDLVKNYRVHPTHWLISTQVLTIRDLGRPRRGLELVGDARIRYARHKE